MKRLMMLAGFLIVVQAAAFSQQKIIDSLLQLISTSKEDTAKVWLLLRVGSAYRNIDLPKGHQFLDSGWNLSRQLSFKTGMFKSIILKTALFRVEGNYDSVLSYNKKLLALAQQLNDTENMGIAYLNLAESYTDFSDAENALASALKGLTIVEKSGKDNLIEDGYSLLLRIYFDRSDYDKALAYGNKAVEISKRMNDPGREAQVLANMAVIYSNKKEYTKAIAASEKVVELSRAIENERFEAYALSNLGDIYLKLNKVDKASMYCKQSLQLAQKTGDKSMSAVGLRGLSICNLLTKKYEQAQRLADSALAIHKELNDPEDIFVATKIMADIAYATGNPAKGYAYERQYDEYQEKHMKQVLSKQSADLEKKYETEKKEARIKSLEDERKLQRLTIRQQHILNYSLIAGAVILAILFFLLYRNYRHKQKLQQQRISELETEKQLAATEAVLKGEELERTRLAKDLHDGLGGMLSGIKYSLNTMKGNLIMTPENAQAFERSIDMLDSCIQEMRRVAHNMMPESLVRFGLNTALKDFCNDIHQSGALQINYQSYGLEGASIEQTAAITIYRIVQELINNAMKHATARQAIVQVTKTNGHISVTVEDDGKGFDPAVLKGSSGMGWSNIQNRVQFLKGTIDVNSQPDKGTSILIELSVSSV